LGGCGNDDEGGECEKRTGGHGGRQSIATAER
jgi:hypothetical protein